jgi:pantoate--beta-alanine ligase
MEVVTRLDELRGKRAKLPDPVGFVPTMGALHAGHASLVELARAQCRSLVVSVFINPLQFGPNEDFSAYPRNVDEDRRLLETLGVDLLYVPDASEVYPRQLDVFVEPTGLAQYFEGEKRPGHFRGVATVVLKLFNMVQPQRAYFGEKDAQQLAVIRRMVADLDIPIDIVACVTQRDAEGLALSSRNAYLTAQERRDAPRLYEALRLVASQLQTGTRDVAAALKMAAQLLPPLREDYLGVVRSDEFRPLQTAPPATELLAIGAAYAGRTRLIDNVKVQTPSKQEVHKR